MTKRGFISGVLLACASVSGLACDLCAIYNASNAQGESALGLAFTVAEQFVPSGAVQLEGNELPKSFLNEAFVDSSITHLVPSYNFSQSFGLSLNVPVIYRRFKRFELEPTGISTNQGHLFGVGDASLIVRWTAFKRSKMKYAIVANLLAGAKFPTGDAGRIRHEVEQDAILAPIYGPGHNHFVGGVHEHDLALGSGSYDGIFGATIDSRWRRCFLASQFQYYLRTEGESTYAFGDEVIVSGGPGGYLLLGEQFTLSLQANAIYDLMAADRLQGQKLNQTGMTAWYLGPQIGLTWGRHFTASLGVDIPLRIYNRGLQNVPDYRAHGSFTLRF